MKVIKSITAVCPSEDEMELEIELAYLNKRLEKLPMNTLRKIPAIKELLEYEKTISYDEWYENWYSEWEETWYEYR